jgi:PadR family transcriptional regulator, regulatory protein PadR
MPRRASGTLLPLEQEILATTLAMHRAGQVAVHGFALAQAMRRSGGSRALTAHGTLYKALGRLEGFGLLSSRWEDPASVEGRPRRRLYELTGAGAEAAGRARSAPAGRPAPRPAAGPA